MTTYTVKCVPATDGAPVDPCGTVGGIAHAPALFADNQVHWEQVNTAHLGEMFVYGFGLILAVWVVGLVIGGIMRVIRSI